MKVVILAHFDYFDERGKIGDLLPVEEIVKHAKDNGCWLVEVYNRQPVTTFDSIKDTDVCNWLAPWEKRPLESRFFEGCEILLTGGYRSLCLKQIFDALSTNNKVEINPDWVVSDPGYINNEIFPLWQYPQNIITKIAS